MAVNSNAIFTAAKGYVYTARIPETGALAPRPTADDISNFDENVGLGAGWVDLGHTDREDLPEFGYEGGDTETLGTWRNAAIREVITEAATDYVIVTLNQFDEEALQLYYGVENAVDAPDGEFVVNDAATATVPRSMTIIIEDGPYRIGFYAPRVSVRREDSMEMAVDAFAKMPLRMSFVKQDPRVVGGTTISYPLFTWINERVIGVEAS